MKTADSETELGRCAADLGVTLELTLFIVAGRRLFEKVTYINDFEVSFSSCIELHSRASFQS